MSNLRAREKKKGDLLTEYCNVGSRRLLPSALGFGAYKEIGFKLQNDVEIYSIARRLKQEPVVDFGVKLSCASVKAHPFYEERGCELGKGEAGEIRLGCSSLV